MCTGFNWSDITIVFEDFDKILHLILLYTQNKDKETVQTKRSLTGEHLSED